MTTPRTRTIARTCGTVILILTATYLLFAVLPFYGNGIHLRSYQEIGGSLVDVKGYPPFTWLGGPAQAVAMLAAGYMPFVSFILTPLLLVVVALNRKILRRSEAALWVTTGAVNIVALALTWQTRSTILTWLVD